MTRRDKKLNSLAHMIAASAIFQPAASALEEEPVLPQVAAARERDRAARARVAAGQDYKPSESELVEGRAWRRAILSTKSPTRASLSKVAA